MGSAKKYFKKQFSPNMFYLEHDVVSDFYICCWQKNRSVLPLLCLRTILFLGCLAILISSLVLTIESMGVGYWFIYLTHWGLLLITLASGCAFAVSVRAFVRGPIDANFGLPWYVKTYWVLYNIAVPMAFMITVFYWPFLSGAATDVDYAIDFTLDVFIHGINSVLMFFMIIISLHPSRILHVIYPLAFGICYLVFSIIYYFAGGTDPRGNVWIYPTLDWSQPGMTIVMVLGTVILLIVMHILVLCIALLRDWCTKRYRRENTLNISSYT